MKDNDWKSRLGMVYSTNPDFQYQTENEKEAPDTLPAERQHLRVTIDKRNRKGKTVTLISGFVGHEENMKALTKWLKTKCGTGGSCKDGEIIIQGDVRQKVIALLLDAGYVHTK